MIFNISNITENTYKSIKNAYDEGIRDFQFEIDSYGGSFSDGLRIYDLMRSDSENVVSARVDGNCMSAATIVLLSAPLNRRKATKHSCFMAHSPLLSYSGDINKRTADQLQADIETAYNQLKSIYLERTESAEVIESYMSNEKCFYADEAKTLGFIGDVEELYNTQKNQNKNNFKIMKKSYLKTIVNKIINGLKNEAVKTKDGVEFDVVSLEIGAPADVADGVYELEDGTVITVEAGIIVDLIAPVAEETTEQVENEGEVETEPATEETAVEEEKEVVVEKVDEIAEQVEEAVTEEEIATIVEQAVEELKEEIINKYKSMIDLVNSVGGINKLVALKNVKTEKKNFVAEKPKATSLEELMARVRK